MSTPRRVAVIGSGVAGLMAAHVAARSARVTLFEADDRLGGHADTHLVREHGRTLAIDTGFIVHNRHTYPTLLRLFAELGVETQESEMSLSVRDDETGLEYAGALGPRGLFPGGANLSNPAYLRLVTEIPRFHRRARALLADPPEDFETVAERPPQSRTFGRVDTTLRDFLRAGRFSAYFERHFMEPLVAAVWSCDPEVALDYPARYLFEFLHHHRMLQVFGSPTWRTVVGGSREYVARVAAGLDDVRVSTKVTSVRDTGSGVEVTDGNGDITTVDAVVIATHPGPALAMLAEPTPEQREVLAAIPYSDNTALLHTDESLLPRAAGARA
ncbi:NAD(P)/FAD-dependent oxidoreductase, partial [Nocardioides sp.]|uniref:NAD(P)/FAD-dependent oxidoreductase n=1 Tax=Nocardioides sp. TaxID=35761 RepID=UPI002D804897